MAEELKDKNAYIEDKIIGFNSIIKFNVKTLFWIFTILYMVLGYLYLDQRKRINNSSKILQSEKQVFLEGVESSIDTDINKVKDDISEIKVGMESIRGDIRLILDRQSRDNPVVESRNVRIVPNLPPSYDTISMASK